MKKIPLIAVSMITCLCILVGCGLQNVKKIVESYNGNMNIQTEEDIFSVKLILYMSMIENTI